MKPGELARASGIFDRALNEAREQGYNAALSAVAYKVYEGEEALLRFLATQHGSKHDGDSHSTRREGA